MNKKNKDVANQDHLASFKKAELVTNMFVDFPLLNKTNEDFE